LLFPNATCVNSAGGTIIGGGAVSGRPLLRLFTTQNGQVTFQYSSQPVAVASNTKTATIGVASATPDGGLIYERVIATTTVTLRAPSAAAVAATPQSLTASGLPQLSQIVISGLTDVGGAPLPDGTKVGLTTVDCAALNQNGTCVSSLDGGQLSPAGTTAGDGTPATNDANFQIYTVAGGEVRAAYSSGSIVSTVNQTRIARVAVVPASAAGATLTNRAIGFGIINLVGVTSAEASGPASLSLANGGSTATVTFSGIKDAAGNVVPDGTVVAVATGSCDLLNSNGTCPGSVGGTIVDGTPNGAGFKMFTVMNGSITVTYSTAGATTGTARVLIGPARPNNTVIGNRVLTGGVWPITNTP
jgi:hypothetical protein